MSLLVSLILIFLAWFVFFKSESRHYFKKNNFLVVNCTIYNEHKQIVRNSPFMGCLYFNDGKVFAKKKRTIFMFDKDGKILWEKDIIYHSVGNIIKNETGIIFLSSEEKLYKGQLARFDVVIEIDLAGNILKKWNVFNNIEQIKKAFNISEIEFWNEYNELFKAKKQFPHANSVYEIPDNSHSHINPAFKKGNFVVSMHGTLKSFIILDSNLENILWVSKRQYHVHDVQILPTGKILIHNNRDPDHFYSQLQEVNPSDESIYWSYSDQNPSSFFSTVAGSVQKLDDQHYLYSTNGPTPHATIIDHNGVKKWYIDLTPTNGGKIHIVRAQLLDLGDYLKNSTSP